MPKKPVKSKGRYPKEPKTSRREIPVWQRAAICGNSGIRSSREEKAYWKGSEHEPSYRTICKIRKRGIETWESSGTRNGANRKPLGDITHHQNKPRSGAPRKLTSSQRKELVAKAVSTRSERRKSAIEHCSDWKNKSGISISESYFISLMYEFGYCRKKAEYKPELTPQNQDLRRTEARKLKKILQETPHLVAFIDAASIRLHEDEDEYAWAGQNEATHTDVKLDKNRDHGYSYGQFFGIIALGERNGPCAIFTKETPEAELTAQHHLDQINAGYQDWLTATHVWANIARQRDEERRGRVYGGPKPGYKA
jgi:transposase